VRAARIRPRPENKYACAGHVTGAGVLRVSAAASVARKDPHPRVFFIARRLAVEMKNLQLCAQQVPLIRHFGPIT
jgi:hypothetical protein